MPSVFPWTKVNKESLCREKKNCKFPERLCCCQPPTLERWVEEIKMENERLLHDELQECKAREKISMFGLEKFSCSNEDI